MGNKHKNMTVTGSAASTEEEKSSRNRPCAAFTVETHLGVQAQIERRARELWHAGGGKYNTALSDWLQAEREVIAEFIGNLASRQLSPQPSGPRVSIGAPRSEPKPRMLKRDRTTAARRRQTISALAACH